MIMKEEMLEKLNEISRHLLYCMNAFREGTQHYAKYAEWRKAVNMAIGYIEEE